MEAVVRVTPELRDSAVVVVEGRAPLLRVVAMTEKARHAGIDLGMTAMQAEERLVMALTPQAAAAAKPGSRIRAWHIRRRSPAQEASAHAALLDCAAAFSPRVEETAADVAILDIAGLEHLFGPPARIARELARRCSEAGLEANVAVAANPDAAACAARGFAGTTVLPPESEAERLGTLPLDVLLSFPLPQTETARQKRKGDRTAELTAAEMLDTLERWGVRKLSALAALPEIALVERLGQQGLYWQRLARGAAQRELVAGEPALVFEEAVELEYPIELLEPLAFVLNRMLEQLCARLSARALATNELRLRMELDPEMEIDREGVPLEVCSTAAHHHAGAASRDVAQHGGKFYERILRLPVPMLDSKTFLKLLQLDLKQHPPGAPVLRLWLAAEPVRARAAQHGLFLPLTPQPERLELTLARLAGIAGEECVGSPELLDTHHPDAFRMRRFVPPSPDRDEQMQADTQRRALAALRRFRPALPVEVQLREGVPVRIEAARSREQVGLGREIRGKVLWAAGPWRSSGEWWGEARWNREEWDVAVSDRLPPTNGGVAEKRQNDAVAIYRIYRDGTTEKWLVDAQYD